MHWSLVIKNKWQNNNVLKHLNIVSRFNSRLISELILVNELITKHGGMWNERFIHTINGWMGLKKLTL
jgi:hypothetical protein